MDKPLSYSGRERDKINSELFSHPFFLISLVSLCPSYTLKDASTSGHKPHQTYSEQTVTVVSIQSLNLNHNFFFARAICDVSGCLCFLLHL